MTSWSQIFNSSHILSFTCCIWNLNNFLSITYFLAFLQNRTFCLKYEKLKREFYGCPKQFCCINFSKIWLGVMELRYCFLPFLTDQRKSNAYKSFHYLKFWIKHSNLVILSDRQKCHHCLPGTNNPYTSCIIHLIFKNV